MAGHLEQNSSRLIAGLAAVALGVLLLFAPAALAQDDPGYPVTSSSSSSSTSSSSTSSSSTSTSVRSSTTERPPTSVRRSTISRDPSGSTTLPRTGNDVLPWVISGVALVAAGGGIIYLTRRTKASA